MPEKFCSSAGIHPEGHKCPHWKDPKCSLADTEKCKFQRVAFTDTEIKAREHISLPAEIKRVLKSIESGINIYELFAKKAYESVQQAMIIIDKVNPLGKESDKVAWSGLWSYWNDGDAIELDMGMLSALYANIAALHAKLSSDARIADTSRSIFKARKYGAIKRSYENGVRGFGKYTEKAIDQAIVEDTEYQETNNAVLIADETAEIMGAALKAIDKHIQVLKKRRETLSSERFGARDLPT